MSPGKSPDRRQPGPGASPVHVAIALGVQPAAALDEVDSAAAQARLRTIREVMTGRQRYVEIS